MARYQKMMQFSHMFDAFDCENFLSCWVAKALEHAGKRTLGVGDQAIGGVFGNGNLRSQNDGWHVLVS